jgi:hypothetical protein
LIDSFRQFDRGRIRRRREFKCRASLRGAARSSKSRSICSGDTGRGDPPRDYPRPCRV